MDELTSFSEKQFLLNIDDERIEEAESILKATLPDFADDIKIIKSSGPGPDVCKVIFTNIQAAEEQIGQIIAAVANIETNING